MLKGIWKLYFQVLHFAFVIELLKGNSGVNLAELSQLKQWFETYLSLRGSDPINTYCSLSGVTSALKSHYYSTTSPLSLVIPLQLICLFVGWINAAPWAILLGSTQEWWCALDFNPILTTFQLELWFPAGSQQQFLQKLALWLLWMIL